MCFDHIHSVLHPFKLQLHFTTSIPLPTSCLLFYSLSVTDTVHMLMRVEPATVAWKHAKAHSSEEN